MRNDQHSPYLWTIVERFYRALKLFMEQHDRYEGKVADHVKALKQPREDIRLDQVGLSELLHFKKLENIRDAYLLPLKDACHVLFRSRDSTDFLDRLVHDIFHEISILKEEHYNILTYAPGQKPDDPEREEMTAILDEVHALFPLKVHRLKHLFEVARGRIEQILPRYRDNVVLIRSLFLHRDGFVAEAYDGGLLHFYKLLYGEDRLFDGFRAVGDSFYHSGFYQQADQCFSAGEEYLHGVPAQAKRRLQASWKETREHFRRYRR